MQSTPILPSKQTSCYIPIPVFQVIHFLKKHQAPKSHALLVMILPPGQPTAFLILDSAWRPSASTNPSLAALTQQGFPFWPLWGLLLGTHHILIILLYGYILICLTKVQQLKRRGDFSISLYIPKWLVLCFALSKWFTWCFMKTQMAQSKTIIILFKQTSFWSILPHSAET